MSLKMEKAQLPKAARDVPDEKEKAIVHILARQTVRSFRSRYQQYIHINSGKSIVAITLFTWTDESSSHAHERTYLCTAIRERRQLNNGMQRDQDVGAVVRGLIREIRV